jgi:polyhydroxybutyrate depolymerase
MTLARCVLALTSATAVLAPLQAAERERALPVGGLSRTYTLVAPKNVTAPLPLIIVFHGGGQTAAQARRYTRFDEFAESLNIAVVYPQGRGNNWNDGRTSADLNERPAAGVDDVAFTREIIGQLVMDGTADPARVFLTGASNGGMMAMRAGCEMPDRIAGIAPVVASQPAEWRCEATGLSALFIHGTDDEYMPYAGGRIAAGKVRRDLGEVLSADDTIAMYKRVNRCTGVKETKTLDKVARDNTKAVITDYDCAKAPLKHIVIEGGGHTWPGARTNILGDWLLGNTSEELSATAEIWTFFKSLPGR